MKKIALILMVIFLVSCKNNNTLVMEGDSYMNWEDPYFEMIFSQVFEKHGSQVTYTDINSVEKISWDYIDEEEYIYVYVFGDTNPICIKKPIKEMKNIMDLRYFKNLKYFDTSYEMFKGIEVLSQLEQLKTLELTNVELNEDFINEISQCTSIETLIIPLADVNYSALEKMPSLNTIKIVSPNYKGTNDYEPLLSLPNKRCLLDLSFIYSEELNPTLYRLFSTHPNISKIGKLQIKDNLNLDFFENMIYLESLDIAGHMDITGISKMSWLKELSIWGTVDFSMLSNLQNLERLELRSDSPIDLNSVNHLRKLKELRLSSKMIQSLNGIQGCIDLKTLVANSCLMEDISSLSGLKKLEHLELKNNIISDITVLESLTNLKYLSLDSNEISDISSLTNCMDLEFLCLDGNFITDISTLSNLKNLKELQIQIDDLNTEKDIDLNLWRNTLLQLTSLKYYAGGIRDDEWIKKNLPYVTHGRSDME